MQTTLYRAEHHCLWQERKSGSRFDPLSFFSPSATLRNHILFKDVIYTSLSDKWAWPSAACWSWCWSNCLILKTVTVANGIYLISVFDTTAQPCPRCIRGTRTRMDVSGFSVRVLQRASRGCFMERSLSLQAGRKTCNCCCSLIKFLFRINSPLSGQRASVAVSTIALPI